MLCSKVDLHIQWSGCKLLLTWARSVARLHTSGTEFMFQCARWPRNTRTSSYCEYIMSAIYSDGFYIWGRGKPSVYQPSGYDMACYGPFTQPPPKSPSLHLPPGLMWQLKPCLDTVGELENWPKKKLRIQQTGSQQIVLDPEMMRHIAMVVSETCCSAFLNLCTSWAVCSLCSLPCYGKDSMWHRKKKG